MHFKSAFHRLLEGNKGREMNDTIQLYVEEAGKGTPVVLIHGFPLDHTIWQPLVPLLQDRARLIMPDLRGFGRSPGPEGVYTMRQMADDVLALLDQMEIGHAIIVGHSMGGYVTLAFAHAYPQRVSGLGFVSTHAAADTPENHANRLKNARKVARSGTGFLTKDMSQKITASPELVEPVREIMEKVPGQTVIAALKGMAERPDSTLLLASMRAPAVVIHGTEDTFVSLERAQDMAQLLPRAWLVQVPNAGHLPMMSAPDVVAGALSELIQASAGYQP